ncbi:hypothetical protein [Dysgonomonas gadei]|uniref:hypothetical protein n=1 Tax=Dysgonomonas gadei TaxID=156974 RepID=UPI003AEF697D
MSSGIYIYLEVERYLAEFITHHFGNPVRMPVNSPESKLVRRFLDKTPENVTPDLPSENSIRIEIPFSKEKDPRVYNYLFPATKKILADYYESILINNMCTELLELSCDPNLVLVDLIYAYCEKHGMGNINDDKNFETIRQKFYRARKKYMKENDLKLT